MKPQANLFASAKKIWIHVFAEQKNHHPFFLRRQKKIKWMFFFLMNEDFFSSFFITLKKKNKINLLKSQMGGLWKQRLWKMKWIMIMTPFFFSGTEQMQIIWKQMIQKWIHFFSGLFKKRESHKVTGYKKKKI